MDSKAFPTCAVLSAITGRLVCDIGSVYEVLNFMTGESLFTHQLPRVSREAWAFMVKKRPDLQQAYDEAKTQVNKDNWQGWAKTWSERYGATMEVCRMGIEDHESIDPLSEIAEMVSPERRIIVTT